MKAYERKLLAVLLKRASSEFANHGCNDLDLYEEGLTPEEAEALHRDMAVFNRTPDDAMTGRYAMDWYVMSYLAHKVLEPRKGPRLVIVESPFAADTPEGIAANVEYARRAVRDCLARGESPIASHLLYTQPGILRDEVPAERQWGIDAGLAWGRVAEATVVYTDRGTSRGMRYGIANAEAAGRPVEYRTLDSIDMEKL